VEQFFKFHSTYEEEKLTLAAYHLDGDAQLWYQLFKEGEAHEVTWEGLKKGLHARYGPTMFEDFLVICLNSNKKDRCGITKRNLKDC
jgi:hypothetical protein